jgi:hypothetical protein
MVPSKRKVVVHAKSLLLVNWCEWRVWRLDFIDDESNVRK